MKAGRDGAFRRWMSVAAAGLSVCAAVRAADQVWIDANADNVWSVAAPNWDGGVPWTFDSSAFFGGIGETVEVAGVLSVSNIAFNADGYVIADANADGGLTLSIAPSELSVAAAGHTGHIRAALSGDGGLSKLGDGVLQLSGANSFFGPTIVNAGLLRLGSTNLALGAAGAGNETYVASGAALDLNGAYSAANGGSRDEDLFISGAGPAGAGALVNTGSSIMNIGFRNLTLQGDATIGGTSRLDLRGTGTFTGNGYTLTKAGSNDMAVSRAVDGCPIIINGGSYILQHTNALGGATPGDTVVNAGSLANWGDRAITENITFNGGGFRENRPGGTFTLAGTNTLNADILVDGVNTRTSVVAGVFLGVGGITNAAGGVLLFTTENALYGGLTVNVGGSALRLGVPGVAGGRLGPAGLANNGNFYIDRAGTVTLATNLAGTGVTHIRYGADVVLSGVTATQGSFRVANGALSLTNGAGLLLVNEVALADRAASAYSPDPTSVVAVVEIPAGCTLTARYLVFGNGTNIAGGSMIGVLNQRGGTVRTTGATDENNGIRLGHYPLGFGTYNMIGGTLVVDNGYDLGIATDGTGWVHQVGGEIFATTVMLNERANALGYGRLTVEGGVLNVSTGGITRDANAPYLVEYGGSGGVIRATASFASPLNATLSGAGGNAITFDTAGSTVTVSGVLSGAGGLNKAGAGVLALTGTNTYGGDTAVSNGALMVHGVLAAGSAVSVQNGGTLGGTGTVNGAVSVAGGGALSPGASPGTLTLNGGLALSAGARMDFELGTNSDRLVVGGDLALGGGLRIADAGGFGAGTNILIQYAGALSGTPPTVETEPDGYDCVVDTTSVPGEVRLVVTSSPLTPFEQWQVLYFGGTNAPNGGAADDWDGDGSNNGSEFGANTNPTNALSALKVTQTVRNGTDVLLTWTAAGVRTNRVQAGSDLLSTNFADLGGPIVLAAPGDTTTNYLDAGGATNAGPRFYRIRVEP